MFVRMLLVALISMLFVNQAKSDIVVFDSSTDWQDATGMIQTEDFEDVGLVANLSVTTDNGSISGGLWNDTVTDPLPIIGGVPAITTWTYSNAPTAWSTEIDLGPGGGGSGLDIEVTYTDATTEDLGTINDSGFLGIVSDDKAIATIEFSTTGNVTSTQEQYSLDNFSSGFAAVPEPCSATMLSLVGVMLIARRRRKA